MITLADFLNDKLFKLPLKYSGDFPSYMENLLINDFYGKIDALNEQIIDNESFQFPLEFIKRTQNQFTKGLVESVKKYYEGKPNEAYKKFENTLRNDLKDFDEVLRFKDLPENTDFYRMRLASPNYPLEQKELFHIPFEKRGLVKSQRFSIPGFPSLYLGSSVYICWEELGRPLRNQFQVVRISNTEKIKILDLSPLQGDELLDNRKLYRYFMTWPLIAACSVKVINKDDTFKPEYIIPQILLQWIRNNHEIRGLTYQTTHIDFEKVSTRGNLTNTVFPVLSNRKSGLCPELKKMFQISEPLSPELLDLVEGFGALKWESLETDPLDLKISNLEIFKGKKTKYSKSVFGELEEYLNNSELKKL